MARSVDSLLVVDMCVRKAVRRLGERTTTGQQLLSAMRNLHRDVGGRALHDLSTQFDPKTDFKAILEASLAAGLGWHDLAEVFNEVRQSDPRGQHEY